MKALELKNRLHSLIDTIQDKEKLKALLVLLKKDSVTDWSSSISSDQKKSIDTGLEDINSGKVFSNQEAQARLNAFIKETK